MIRHLCFINKRHYGSLSHEKTVEKFRETMTGEYIDFDLMERLRKDKKTSDEEAARQHKIDRNTPVSMEHVLKELCGEELYNLMKRGW